MWVITVPNVTSNRCRDFFAKCLIHLIAFITCCHPIVTLKSPLGIEEQPRILDHVTVLTATNLSLITPIMKYLSLIHI